MTLDISCTGAMPCSRDAWAKSSRSLNSFDVNISRWSARSPEAVEIFKKERTTRETRVKRDVSNNTYKSKGEDRHDQDIQCCKKRNRKKTQTRHKNKTRTKTTRKVSVNKSWWHDTMSRRP